MLFPDSYFAVQPSEHFGEVSCYGEWINRDKFTPACGRQAASGGAEVYLP